MCSLKDSTILSATMGEWVVVIRWSEKSEYNFKSSSKEDKKVILSDGQYNQDKPIELEDEIPTPNEVVKFHNESIRKKAKEMSRKLIKVIMDNYYGQEAVLECDLGEEITDGIFLFLREVFSRKGWNIYYKYNENQDKEVSFLKIRAIGEMK